MMSLIRRIMMANGDEDMSKWKLIADLTLEEERTSIVFDKYADGSEIGSLSDIMYHGNVLGTGDYLSYIRFKTNAGDTIFEASNTVGKSSGSGAKTVLFLKKMANMWLPLYFRTTESTYSSSPTLSVPEVSEAEPIEVNDIRLFTVNPMAAGSHILIYGKEE